MGKAISLRVSSLPAKACKVVKQMETPRLPDPIMRRLCADREEKRASGRSRKRNSIRAGRLDSNDPNQRRLSDRFSSPRMANHFLASISYGIMENQNSRALFSSLLVLQLRIFAPFVVSEGGIGLVPAAPKGPGHDEGDVALGLSKSRASR
jgi:hypothetical protein